MKLYFPFTAILLIFVFVCQVASSAQSEFSSIRELTYRKDNNSYLLILKPGQKVIESLSAFMEKEKLSGAHFTAIGSVKNPEIAYYDLETKTFKPKIFKGSKEVVSLSGSLGYFEQKPIVHAHISFAGSDFKVYGGHLQEADVALFLEVFITPTNKRIVRQQSLEFPSVKEITLTSPVKRAD